MLQHQGVQITDVKTFPVFFFEQVSILTYLYNIIHL